MNDRDLETRLRDAYRVEAANTDPGALHERVHSIPATVEPQRRRWWYRMQSDATRHAGLGGAQVRGAKNMLDATRIAAVVAGLALGATFLAVQVSEPPETRPQPAADSNGSWALVTATQFLGEDCGDGTDGTMCGEVLDASDPRLAGQVRIAFESDEDPEGSYTALWTTVSIANDEGSWQGQAVGFVDEVGAHRHMAWLDGAGAYEGLAILGQLTEARGPDIPSFGRRMHVDGLLYEGELPPMVTADWVATPE